MTLNSIDMDHALLKLKQHWGFDRLRSNQEPIIKKVFSGENVLALLPTGGGKSICFQLPGLCRNGLTVVISPLVALMEDQVAQLVSRGITAAAIHSGMSANTMAKTLSKCQSGELKFLYCSPERLQSQRFQCSLMHCNVSLVAVDEAHCISQWGYDFRPDYLRIKEFLSLIPDVQVIALTASATPEVLADIIEQLNLSDQSIVRSSFARTNLAYRVQRCENKTAAVLRMCRQNAGSGILYCQTRGECVWWSDYLVRMGILAAPYHAGLSHELKMTTFQKWMSNELKIVCATSAFGMGIDKPDVRFVLHAQMPLQPEAYFQEAGRAGRDGLDAFSQIFWNEEDIAIARQRLSMKFPSIDKVAECYDGICASCGIDYTHPIGSTFDFDAIAFCKLYKIDPWQLQGAIKSLEGMGYLTLDNVLLNFTEIKITATPQAVSEFIHLTIPEAQLLHALLGMYGRLFERMTKINEHAIAAAMGRDTKDVLQSLGILSSGGWIDVQYAKQDLSVRLLKPRTHSKLLILMNSTSKILQQREFQRAAFMTEYLQSNKCRSQSLLQYFGEVQPNECGICDVCMSKEITNKDLFKSWLHSIIFQRAVTLNELKSKLYRKGWRKEYGIWLRELLDDGSFLLNQNQCIQVRD